MQNMNVNSTKYILLVLFLIYAGGEIVWAGDRECLPPKHTMHLLLSGPKLSSDEAIKLEKSLRKNPNQPELRLRLVAYYPFVRGKEYCPEWPRHIIWLLENYTECKMLTSLRSYIQISKSLHPKEYQQVAIVLDRLLTEHKDSARLHALAASFFIMHDQEKSEKLLIRLCQLKPKSAEAYNRLSHFYLLKAIGSTQSEQIDCGKKALQAAQIAIELSSGSDYRFCMMENALKASYLMGDMELSKHYAKTIIQTQSQNLIHTGHTYLGLLALKQGDLSSAKQHLLASVNVKTTAVLSSFGPTMDLANPLYAQGEKKSVLLYLEKCKILCPSKISEYDLSITKINNGEKFDLRR